MTFEGALGEVALQPGRTGGVFDVWVGDVRVWNRAADGGLPELKQLKRRVRALVAPGMALGHSDAPAGDA